MTITMLVSNLFPTFKSHSATLSTFKSRSSGTGYEFGDFGECGFFAQLAHMCFLVKELRAGTKIQCLAQCLSDSVFNPMSERWGINGGEMDKMKKKNDPPLSLI